MLMLTGLTVTCDRLQVLNLQIGVWFYTGVQVCCDFITWSYTTDRQYVIIYKSPINLAINLPS